MTTRRGNADLLKIDTPTLVRSILAGEVTWPEPLHSGGEVIDISGLRASIDVSWRKVPPTVAWTGLALLANWAPTPFIVDDLWCASVESFYHSLKFPENSDERKRIACLPGPEAQHVAPRRRGSTFSFRGGVVSVNSPEHAAVIAAAVVAKLSAHSEVTAALEATGDAELSFPYGLDRRNALAQATPLAFMIERARRRCA